MRYKILKILKQQGESIHCSQFEKVAGKIKEELTKVGITKPYFDFICNHFRLSKEDICSKSRKDHIVMARHLLVCLLNELEPRMTLSKIMESVNMDHASIYYILDKLEYQKGFKNEYEILKDAFLNKGKTSTN